MASVNLSPLFNGTTQFGPTYVPLAGGQLFTYQAGSSTALTTYADNAGTIPNSNPIILGTDGKLPNELWLQSGYSYKFVLEDASSNIVDTYDNIAGIITSIPSTSPAVPSGCILIWSGSVGSIPSGFVLCNGSNGTPDLRNSFVLGAGNSYSVGQTGGSTTATLTQGNLPNVNFNVTDPGHVHTASTTVAISDPGHNHSASSTSSSTSTVTDPGHFHTVPYVIGSGTGIAAGSGDSIQPNQANSGTAFTGITVSTATTTSTSIATNLTGITATASTTIASNVTGITVASGGSGSAFGILPPYYALAYIMKS